MSFHLYYLSGDKTINKECFTLSNALEKSATKMSTCVFRWNASYRCCVSSKTFVLVLRFLTKPCWLMEILLSSLAFILFALFLPGFWQGLEVLQLGDIASRNFLFPFYESEWFSFSSIFLAQHRAQLSYWKLHTSHWPGSPRTFGSKSDDKYNDGLLKAKL